MGYHGVREFRTCKSYGAIPVLISLIIRELNTLTHGLAHKVLCIQCLPQRFCYFAYSIYRCGISCAQVTPE